MMRHSFEDRDFARYKLGWFLIIVGVVIAGGLGYALTESQFGYSILGSIGTLRDASEPNGKPEAIEKREELAKRGGEPNAVATSGGRSPAVVIRDLESTSASSDGRELIGRKVDITVPVQSRANDQAFWVGTGDTEMLVAIRRDDRNAEQRYYVEPAKNGVIDDIHAGEEIVIKGTIQPIPYREAMYSWGLTTDDVERLHERPIYIAADSVQPAGKGE